MTLRARPALFLTAASLPARLAVTDRAGDTHWIDCADVVRELPGRRLVCRASWQGQAVYAKFYAADRQGRRHWLREQRGAARLAQHGLPAPPLLLSRHLRDLPVCVNLFLSLDPGVTLRAAWVAAEGEHARTALLCRAARTLAHLHACGLLHTDPHPDNFLLDDDGVVALLDAGAIAALRRDHHGSASLASLGAFLAQFPPDSETLFATVAADYASARGWPADARLLARVQAAAGHAGRQRRVKYLEKIYRECTEIVCRRDWRRVTLYRRDCEHPQLAALLADPDASLATPATQSLKAGNTATLWSVPVAGRRRVVKRYNIKHGRHALNRLLRRTRASISWTNAHRLMFYGLPVARPVALVETRYGPLRGRAWFISEQVVADDIQQCVQQAGDDVARVESLFDQVAGLLVQLRALRISHGDMKASNCLCSEDGVVLIDLDAMRQFRSATSFRRAHERDVERFLRNWSGTPHAGLVRRVFVRAGLLGTAT